MSRILRYPNPRLRVVAAPVESIDDTVRARVFQMLKILVEEEGIGLAAPQIGWPVRMFVMNVHPHHDPTHSVAIFNPEIVSVSGKTWSMTEGCLSFPGISGKIERPWEVRFKGQNLEGASTEFELHGLPARCMLHEFDHLDGILFIDRMSPARQQAIKGKLRRLEEEFPG